MAGALPSRAVGPALAEPRSGFGMNWESFVKRYVWDDDRTPYLVRVGRITRRQADYEIYVYTVFLGVLFAVVTIAALAGALPQGRSEAVALYGFSVVCAAILFGATKHLWAALYCSAVPLAALFYLFTRGLPLPSRHDRSRRPDRLRADLSALLDAHREPRQGLPRPAGDPARGLTRRAVRRSGRPRTGRGRRSAAPPVTISAISLPL